MKCLLITSIFPPLHGGSAVVYENMCRFAPPGSMHVLTPWRNYQNNELIDGWRLLDSKASYPIHRIEQIRPPAINVQSAWQSLQLSLTIDLPLRRQVFSKISKIIREEKIDVICIGELLSGTWFGIQAKKKFGCKLINYIHGEEITSEFNSRLFKNRREKYLAQADAVIAVSNFTRQALINQMGVPADKIELIKNGVNTKIFVPRPKNHSLAKRYSLEEKKIIFSVGRLIPRKGFDMTIKALPAILEQHPDTHYLIAGTGEYRTELEIIAAENNVTQHVTFAGRVPDEELVDHYNLCDLFAMPNREMPDGDTEGFGLVFLEANACGKTVIAGNAGGAVEAVTHMDNGLIVDGCKPDEISNSIIKILSNLKLKERLENQSMTRATASSFEHCAKQFFDLCVRLTNQGTINNIAS